MPLAIQNLPNVYSDLSTYEAVEKFLSCPSALKFVQSDSVFKPLYVMPSNTLFSPRGGLTFGDDYSSPISSEISLPAKSLESDEAVKNLAFEIFNLKTDKSFLLAKAEKGEVGMDEFARAIEIQESEDTKNFVQLREQCSEIWDLPVDDLDYEFVNMDQETNLFAQEVQCHTDAIRKQWIDKFKKIYCAKHPDDTRSCTAKKKDLCNLQELYKDPNGQNTMEIVTERTCRLFPNASQSVKNYPKFRTIVEAFCPEALPEENTFLATAVSLIGGLAAAIFGVRTLYPNR